MIYSVLILIVILFLFFVVFDNFKKTRKEQYINFDIAKIKALYKDKMKNITNKNIDNFIDIITLKSKKITKEEAKKIMDEEKNILTGLYKVIKVAS